MGKANRFKHKIFNIYKERSGKLMKKIGVILADTKEYEPFINYFSKSESKNINIGGNEAMLFHVATDCEVIAVHCGIGKVNASNAAAALIYLYGANIILSAGLSGVVSGLRREDIIAGTEYVECDFDLRALGLPLGVKPDGEEYIHKADSVLLSYAMEYPNMKSGRLGTGDLFLSDKVKKNEYLKTFSISAFDMETAAIASVCSKNAARFLSVRKISDDADDTSKDDYREMNDRCDVALSEIVKFLVDKIQQE